MKIQISGQSAAAGGGYSTVEDEGTPQTQRTTINFTGAGVTASDSGGKTVVNIPGGSGATTGTTTVDFGLFPGGSDASVTITGQASIASNSRVEAWLEATATADHSADEHVVEPIRVVAGNISAGTGFTIYAVNTNPINEPLELKGSGGNKTLAGQLTRSQGFQQLTAGGTGTRIYGQWTVGWRWT